ALATAPDWEGARNRARAIKDETLLHLDRYLEEFSANAERAGARVHWARDAAEACEVIGRIAEQRGARTVVKSKSMTSEEIHLNAALAARGIEPVETDLGEYIVQLAGEAPSHSPRADGDREGGPARCRSGSVSAVAPAIRDRPGPHGVSIAAHGREAAPRGRGAGGAAHRAARQRPLRHASRPGDPSVTRVYSLRRVPQRLPGIPADRRPRVRVGVSGPDRRGVDPPAVRVGEIVRAAVRIQPVWRLPRRLSRQDRYPGAAAPPAR